METSKREKYRPGNLLGLFPAHREYVSLEIVPLLYCHLRKVCHSHKAVLSKHFKRGKPLFRRSCSEKTPIIIRTKDSKDGLSWYRSKKHGDWLEGREENFGLL